MVLLHLGMSHYKGNHLLDSVKMGVLEPILGVYYLEHPYNMSGFPQKVALLPDRSRVCRCLDPRPSTLGGSRQPICSSRPVVVRGALQLAVDETPHHTQPALVRRKLLRAHVAPSRSIAPRPQHLRARARFAQPPLRARAVTEHPKPSGPPPRQQESAAPRCQRAQRHTDRNPSAPLQTPLAPSCHGHRQA
jgi:hypothetical protein